MSKKTNMAYDKTTSLTKVDIIRGSLFLLLGLIILNFISIKNYLLFHSLVELFSIVIAFSIFVLAWNARRFIRNDYILFLGVAFLFIGAIDLIHTLAYKGMGVFPDKTSNLPTQLWIVARYLQTVSFAVGIIFIKKKLNLNCQILVFSSIFILILLSIFTWEIFPDCYIEGVGLTSFKIVSEYIICIILIISIYLLFRNRAKFNKHVLNFLIVSIVLMIFSELAFTFYISVYGLSNFVGHIFKFLSFYFIYLALVKSGIENPHNIIFRELKESREKLKKMAHKDALTKTYNRHYLHEYLEKELERSLRYKHRLGLVMIDIDGFKEVNDKYSHLVGDKVLEEIGKLFMKTVRKPDIVIRYGGDEFLLLLPETGPKVDKLVQRLKAEINKWNKENDLIDFPLTLSFGISYYDPEVHEKSQINEILDKADKRMYRNKKS